MTSLLRHRDRPDNWTLPRQRMHASERFLRYGKVQPMIEPRQGFLAKLFGRG